MTEVLGICAPLAAAGLATVYAESIANFKLLWDPGAGGWWWAAMMLVSMLAPGFRIWLQQQEAFLNLETLPAISRSVQNEVAAHLTRYSTETDLDPVGELSVYCTVLKKAVASALRVGERTIECDVMVALTSQDGLARLEKETGTRLTNPYGPADGGHVGLDGLVDEDVQYYLAAVAGSNGCASIFLRVPSDEDRALPGAPTALLTVPPHDELRHDNIDDVTTLARSEKFSDSASPEIRRQVQTYFATNLGTVKSVISVALHTGSDQDAVCGVVNITSKKRNLFAETERPQQYLIEGIVRPRLPLLADLARTIVERVEASQ